MFLVIISGTLVCDISGWICGEWWGMACDYTVMEWLRVEVCWCDHTHCMVDSWLHEVTVVDQYVVCGIACVCDAVLCAVCECVCVHCVCVCSICVE